MCQVKEHGGKQHRVTWKVYADVCLPNFRKKIIKITCIEACGFRHNWLSLQFLTIVDKTGKKEHIINHMSPYALHISKVYSPQSKQEWQVSTLHFLLDFHWNDQLKISWRLKTYRGLCPPGRCLWGQCAASSFCRGHVCRWAHAQISGWGSWTNHTASH